MVDKAHRRVQGKGAGKAISKAAEEDQGLVDREPQVAESASSDGQAAATTNDRLSGFIVGIGASAGGLASIERFFHAIPAGTRIAFVLVQHLSPDHRSLMAEIMVKHTSLRVEQATNGRMIESGTLYLIPPGKVMRVTEGRLTLEDRDATSLHFPIDIFFQSMAEEFGSSVIAVVLSGTGSDGTQGIRYVKQSGGTVLVQDDTAQFDGMPRSAISTGLADFILPPDQIAAKVVELAQVDESRFQSGIAIPVALLERVLAAVWKESGLDFHQYRERTLRRRIEKRMWLSSERDPESYVRRLEGDAVEVKALCQELMIGVTSLFRDPEAFQIVRTLVLPSIFVDGANLRVWVVGCSTGEEAYSIAILLDDYMRDVRIKSSYRVFATDIDDRAIAQAGRGVFSAQLVSHLDPDLVARSFVRDGDSYRVATRIRERIVFAKHDVVKDPPFTKMDLVSCRNLLIHQQGDLQERTLGMLQFALRENGFLWLGSTESLGRREDSFRPIHQRWRIFQRTNLMSATSASSNATADVPLATTRRGIVERQVHRLEAALLSQICSAVVRRNDQAAVVVSANEAVLYLFGNLAPFFTIPEGRPSSTLSRGLAAPLANVVGSLLRRMRREGLREATGRGTMPDDSGMVSVVDIVVLAVEPGRDMESVYLIVLAQPTAKRALGDALSVDAASSSERITELEGALIEAKSHLQVTIEELESSNEELQSANEELIASNEELQSTNEELHSVNEELHTVNAEYQRKLAEQHMLTADMEHLLQTTDIGTIFFDAQNRVRRFTPAITGVIPLLSADVGRPIGHIKHLLLDVDLERVAHEVKKDGGRVEMEVRTTDGRTFMLRAVPYHDYGDHVDGVVVTLFDVTALDRARREIAEKERRFRQVAENIDDVIWVREGVTGAFLYLSPVAELFWGRSVDDMMNNPELWLHGVHEDDRERVAAGYARGLRKGVFQLEYRIVTPDGATRWVQDRGFPVIDDESSSMQVAGVTTDVTASKQTEDELRSAAQTMTRLALHDVLTGLHNRRGFEQALAAELGRAQRSGDPLAAVLIDCDNFKRINDEFGHDAGDEVLREISHRLGMSVRPSDVMARIGGDEFLALLPSTRKAEALRVAERMRATVAATPVFVRGKDLAITVSIGVSALDPNTLTMPQLLADLHHGLAASKRLGKNRVADARGDGIAAITPEAFGGLLRSESSLRVVAQSIRSLVDGEIVGYELLSRGPAGLLESPEALFRTASSFGMLSMTDMQCLRRCLKSAARLRVAGKPLRFHLNVYPSTLLEMTEAQREEIFEGAHGHDDLCLEISEQQVVGQPTYLRDSIQTMRDLGLRIAIDDVGFGRSSLESLIVLEPDMIKIDRSFVNGIATERQRRGFLSRLLTIAESLKSDVVAEGIENDADAAVLQDLGVRQAQGWLWDRPAPIESLN